MAIYHCSIKIISRGKGKSAVAAAAYRSGEKITNEYDGIIHDYTRKGGVVHTEILLPRNAPASYADRAVLWNAVEKIEKAKNSQLAREIELALPVELTKEQSISLTREYCEKHFVSFGMCADVCIHDKNDGNPHAHIMLTMRPFESDGTWGDKQKKEYLLDTNGEKIYDKKKRQYKCKSIPTTDWNEQTKAEEWRHGWANAVNAILEQQGAPERIDHRSYERQGIEQIPTVHMGVAVTQMERRGIATEKGNRNREIDALNSRLRQIKARIRKLQTWADEERTDAAPTLAEVFTEIASNPERRNQKQQIADVKLAAQTLNFVTENGIATLADMTAVVKKLRSKYDELHNAVVPMSRRFHTLVEHIVQAENYSKFAKTYNQYNALKGEKQETYYKKHNNAITAFTTAHEYMTRHLNGRKSIPLNEWRNELAELSVKRDALLLESDKLTVELRSAETIKRNAEKGMRAGDPGRKATRSYEME